MPAKRKSDASEGAEHGSGKKARPDKEQVELTYLGEGGSNVRPPASLKDKMREALAHLRGNESLAPIIAAIEEKKPGDALVDSLVAGASMDPFCCVWEAIAHTRQQAKTADSTVASVKSACAGTDDETTPKTPTPEQVLSSAEQVHKLMKGKKGNYVLSAATFFKERGDEFSADAKADATDEELWKSELTAEIDGLGPSIMRTVMLKAYGRLDVLPAGVKLVDDFVKAERKKGKGEEEVVKAWRPYRGVAALLLWEHAALSQ
ncbi:hypothetical protein KFE25_014368 [Diacronema lutheri]|uniref:HhH-GPD domain-containing protein n=1 Tax=Diacronema lutheri TaxID=2081491 RepID=A0A8J5XJK4_DIALT|nr:hypothetical protein KFE25_014368 [Diacronema lutheri]